MVRDLHTAIQGHRKGSSAWLDINEIPTEDGMLQVGRYGSPPLPVFHILPLVSTVTVVYAKGCLRPLA